jgi:hypothetical protein
MSEIRVLEPAEQAEISERCRTSTLQMYRTPARKSRDEKIRDGVMVYTREFLMPHAKRVGLWEKFLAEGFDALQPNTEPAWPVLAGPRR